jgi:hypothetical protein
MIPPGERRFGCGAHSESVYRCSIHAGGQGCTGAAKSVFPGLFAAANEVFDAENGGNWQEMITIQLLG